MVCGQAEQHFGIAKSLKEAKNSLKQAAQRNVDHQQVLDATVMRLVKLREKLAVDVESQQPENTAEDEVIREIGEEPVVIADAALFRCGVCGKAFLPGLLQHHAKFCDPEAMKSFTGLQKTLSPGKYAANPDEDMGRCSACGEPVPRLLLQPHEDQCRMQRMLLSRANEAMYSLQTEAAAAMPPGPPTNIKLDSETYNSVRVTWSAPIFSGGQPVYEHEIKYELYVAPERSRETRQEVVTTSRWCLDYPVALESFVLTGLSPSCDILNVRVRCINRIGQSEWSSDCASTKTQRTWLRFFVGLNVP